MLFDAALFFLVFIAEGVMCLSHHNSAFLKLSFHLIQGQPMLFLPFGMLSLALFTVLVLSICMAYSFRCFVLQLSIMLLENFAHLPMFSFLILYFLMFTGILDVYFEYACNLHYLPHFISSGALFSICQHRS